MSHMLYRVAKRIFDILCSLLAIIITSPLWLVIACGIKASSKGPVFYRSERIGKDRKGFVLYKFRSMHEYRQDALDPGRDRERGAVANEKRMFAFGRFLRKSKLDELPQMLNVLLADMSVIGPRPLTSAGIRRQYQGIYESITTVRPGLACLDSLYDYAHGELVVSENEEFMAKIMPVRRELARMYVERMNAGLDLYCMARTVRLIFEVVVLKKREFPYTGYEAEAVRNVFGDSTAAD